MGARRTTPATHRLLLARQKPVALDCTTRTLTVHQPMGRRGASGHPLGVWEQPLLTSRLPSARGMNVVKLPVLRTACWMQGWLPRRLWAIAALMVGVWVLPHRTRRLGLTLQSVMVLSLVVLVVPTLAVRLSQRRSTVASLMLVIRQVMLKRRRLLGRSMHGVACRFRSFAS